MSDGPSDVAPSEGADGTREPGRTWARDPVSGRLVSEGSVPGLAEATGGAPKAARATKPAASAAKSEPSESTEMERLRLDAIRAEERANEAEARLAEREARLAEREAQFESEREQRGTAGATSEFLHDRLRALESENRAVLARLAESERVNEIQRGKLDKLQTTRDRVKQLSSRRDGEVAQRESQRGSRKSSVTSAQERAERDVEGLMRSKEPSEADRASQKSAERELKREQKRERERVERERIAKEVREAEAKRVREAMAEAEVAHAALRTKLAASLALVESQPLAQIVERKEFAGSEECSHSESSESWGQSEVESRATENTRGRERSRGRKTSEAERAFFSQLTDTVVKLGEKVRQSASGTDQQAKSFSDLRGRVFEGPLPQFKPPGSRPLAMLNYTWDYQDTLAAELRRTFPADARGLVDGVFAEARASHSAFTKAIQSQPGVSRSEGAQQVRGRGRVGGRRGPLQRSAGGLLVQYVPPRGRERMKDTTRAQREEWIESQILLEFRRVLPAAVVERAKSVCGKDPWASALVFFLLVSIYSDSGSQRNEMEDELLEIKQKQGETLGVFVTRFEQMSEVFGDWSLKLPSLERMKVPILAAIEKRVEQLPEAQRFAWWEWYSQVNHESWRGSDYAKLWEVINVAEDLCVKHPTPQEQSGVRAKTDKGEEQADTGDEQ